MRPSLARLFDRHAATVHAGRARFARLADGRAWEYDGRLGVLRAGDLELPAGLLATESAADGAWTWAWADDRPGAALGAIREAIAVRDYGRERGLAELLGDRPAPPSLPPATLATLAAAIVGAPACFRGGAGDLVLTILLRDHPSLRDEGEAAPARLGSDYLRALAELPIADHRRALEGLAVDRGLDPVAAAADRLVVAGPDGSRLVARFAGGRLVELGLDRSAPAPPSAREEVRRCWPR